MLSDHALAEHMEAAPGSDYQQSWDASPNKLPSGQMLVEPHLAQVDRPVRLGTCRIHLRP